MMFTHPFSSCLEFPFNRLSLATELFLTCRSKIRDVMTLSELSASEKFCYAGTDSSSSTGFTFCQDEFCQESALRASSALFSPFVWWRSAKAAHIIPRIYGLSTVITGMRFKRSSALRAPGVFRRDRCATSGAG